MADFYNRQILVPAVVLLLAGCSAGNDSDQSGNLSDAPEPAGAAIGNTPAPAASQPIPDATGAPTAQDARAVLQRYFALVEAGQDEEAASLWWDAARASDFARRLSAMGGIDPNIAAPGRIEGAAGSAYVSISLQLLDGSRSLADGTAVLRRVNDVPGSTAEQRRWRIHRISLQPPPVPLPTPASYRFVGRWASEAANCQSRAWRFTSDKLTTPAGSVCNFQDVREVSGGYDIAATCTAEGPPTDDTLELRFAESARALLFESDVIAGSGLVRC